MISSILGQFSISANTQVHQLTPRLWKQLFAANPLRSDLHGLGS